MDYSAVPESGVHESSADGKDFKRMLVIGGIAERAFALFVYGTFLSLSSTFLILAWTVCTLCWFAGVLGKVNETYMSGGIPTTSYLFLFVMNSYIAEVLIRHIFISNDYPCPCQGWNVLRCINFGIGAAWILAFSFELSLMMKDTHDRGGTQNPKFALSAKNRFKIYSFITITAFPFFFVYTVSFLLRAGELAFAPLVLFFLSYPMFSDWESCRRRVHKNRSIAMRRWSSIIVLGSYLMAVLYVFGMGYHGTTEVNESAYFGFFKNDPISSVPAHVPGTEEYGPCFVENRQFDDGTGTLRNVSIFNYEYGSFDGNLAFHWVFYFSVAEVIIFTALLCWHKCSKGPDGRIREFSPAITGLLNLELPTTSSIVDSQASI